MKRLKKLSVVNVQAHRFSASGQKEFAYPSLCKVDWVGLQAYKDNYIKKKAQRAAEKVALSMSLKRQER